MFNIVNYSIIKIFIYLISWYYMLLEYILYIIPIRDQMIFIKKLLSILRINIFSK